MMTLRPVLLVMATYLIPMRARASCPPEQNHSGCKIVGAGCKCGWGCRADYVFSTRRACRAALKAVEAEAAAASAADTGAPACSGAAAPCARGTCLQTSNDVGYICKCEGTGFYGHHCEKACLSAPVRGMVFPHECIVI